MELPPALGHILRHSCPIDVAISAAATISVFVIMRPFPWPSVAYPGSNKQMYENAMFVGFDRSRWIHELYELDRIIDQNLEHVLEQRRVLASLDVGREADLITEFLEEPNLYRRSREVA
jgi:hypothetical protein